MFGKILDSFPQLCLSLISVVSTSETLGFYCVLFLQHRYFKGLMNSQISSRIVKARRSKLQSVVHKITASWESSAENLHLDGSMITCYSLAKVIMLASAELSP